MNNYAIFGVIAGIALLTTTTVSILPVQPALAVCTSNPFTGEKAACANDPVTGGGAFAVAPSSTKGLAAGANNEKHLFNEIFIKHAGRACTESFRGGQVLVVCVP